MDPSRVRPVVRLDGTAKVEENDEMAAKIDTCVSGSEALLA